MNISEATKKFCEVAGINPESKAGDIVCKMIGIETDWEHSYRNKKIPYDDCVDIAYRRMINWYENALDYHFTDASELVASHRRACAWTILFARGL